MIKEKLEVRNKFYAGIIRDDKSDTIGAVSNAEEVDIYSNADFIQPEQINSADTMPASTSIYAYAAGDDDTVYGYGANTAGSNEVRIVKVTTGGANNPGAFTTLFTSGDTTDLSTAVSDFKFFRTSEANPTYLYYIKGASTTWKLQRYDITGNAEGTEQTLSGLNGSFMRPTMKVIYGELFICHGRFIAKVDGDGVFTEKAFTLPQEWEAIDIVPVSDFSLILCRNKNKKVNLTRAFWWDLTSATTFDDSFDVPMGGPLWVVNYKEILHILCSNNGTARIYVAPAFKGAKPQELPNFELQNVGTDATLQPVSSPKMVSEKDGVIYFGLLKTDKSGIYALGQLDSTKPVAIVLSKRFHTTDYSKHSPTSLLVHGPNYYSSFSDNGTASHARCETNNSPSRSSNAIIETVWENMGSDFRDKDLLNLFIRTYPLSASTSIATSVASDFNSSYTAVTRADATNHATANAVMAKLATTTFKAKKAFKVKCAFTSNGTNGVKLQAIGYHIQVNDSPANS